MLTFHKKKKKAQIKFFIATHEAQREGEKNVYVLNLHDTFSYHCVPRSCARKKSFLVHLRHNLKVYAREFPEKKVANHYDEINYIHTINVLCLRTKI